VHCFRRTFELLDHKSCRNARKRRYKSADHQYAQLSKACHLHQIIHFLPGLVGKAQAKDGRHEGASVQASAFFAGLHPRLVGEYRGHFADHQALRHMLANQRRAQGVVRTTRENAYPDWNRETSNERVHNNEAIVLCNNNSQIGYFFCVLNGTGVIQAKPPLTSSTRACWASTTGARGAAAGAQWPGK